METTPPTFTIIGWCETTPTLVRHAGIPAQVEFRLRPWKHLGGPAPTRRPEREELVVVRGDLATTCLRLVRPGRRVAVEGTIHHRVEDPDGERRLIAEFHVRGIALVWPLATRRRPSENSRP